VISQGLAAAAQPALLTRDATGREVSVAFRNRSSLKALL
jgi:hypothetical protein